MRPLFISGIGTGIGKTVVAAILAETLKADYWKPVQAGYEPETDSARVVALISNTESVIHPETYTLQLAASPHIAARNENRRIEISRILSDYQQMNKNRPLIIEGAGGLMVPLNEKEFVLDLVKQLDARLILVSRNYLGSINHSLMTAALCRSEGLDVAGWIFNDQYLHYEAEISAWSGLPSLHSMPLLDTVSKESVSRAAREFPPAGISYLYSSL
jgi:dethiobiotin synthetase